MPETTATETANDATCCAPTCCAPDKAKADADVHAQVRQAYAAAATVGSGCATGCSTGDNAAHARNIGYEADDLAGAAADGNLGLGCGNPGALASLTEGEVVLDLGSGAGFDAMLAARRVGPSGRVVGVDMTPEMLALARRNAVDADVAGFVEFREGFIEDLPVVADSVDVVISNCVVNLSPDKPAVFREAFRVLKPGGRVAVSDIVLSKALPDTIADNVAAYVGCVGGASTEADYLGAIRDAGFVDVEYERFSADDMFRDRAIALLGEETALSLAGTVWSYKVTARKP